MIHTGKLPVFVNDAVCGTDVCPWATGGTAKVFGLNAIDGDCTLKFVVLSDEDPGADPNIET